LCYNLKYYERKIKKIAKREGLDDSTLDKIPQLHFVNGFGHPDLIVVKDDEPNKINALSWGLIPFWVKNTMDAVKISNQTLNAVGETIFEKPAFRNAAKNQRCVIFVDGFYECHHIDAKTKVPFYIYRADGEPMILAGLWEIWHNDKDGITRQTASIVTTKANHKMSLIHNNPTAIQRNGPRMPVILPDELMRDWLRHEDESKAESERLKQLLLPFPDDLLKVHPVANLQGKEGSGNSARASEPINRDIGGLNEIVD
jgi:putative SOS response-associated peptidase YedK